MFIDKNLRLSGSDFDTPDDPGDATSAGELSTNYIDLATAPVILGDGRDILARFTVTAEAFTSATANATTEFRLVTQPKTGSTYTFTFTAEADDDTITATAHGMVNGTRITVANSGGALPTGLSASTSYYVIEATTDTFQLATTPGGAAIDITGDGSGTQTATWYFETIASSGPIGIQRLQIGTAVTIRVNPHQSTNDYPAHRYLYAFYAPSATLTAGKCFADIVLESQRANYHHATSIAVT